MRAVPAPIRPAPWSAADARAVTHLMLLVVALRVATALVAFLVNVTFPLDRPEQFTMLGATHYFWDPFTRYDSGWYYGIAARGYQWVEGGRNNLAFFPAYPWLMGVVGRLLGGTQGDIYFAGIVVSWVASVAAAGFVYATARLDLPAERAWDAALLTFVFPFAFFFGVVYSEGLFLCGLAAAIYGLRTRRWWLGAVAGALATATRVNGVMALPALVWLAWRAAGPDPRERSRALLAAAGTAAGILAYCGFNWALTGDPFEWYHAITRWGYHPGSAVAANPLATFVANLASRPYDYMVNEHAAPYDVLNGLFPLLMAVTLPLLWWRLGAGYALLIAANLALPLSSGQFEGLGRYCAVLFPFQIWVAAVTPDRWRPLVFAAYGVLYALALTMFTTLHSLF
jgi:hypothetical protein